MSRNTRQLLVGIGIGIAIAAVVVTILLNVIAVRVLPHT